MSKFKINTSDEKPYIYVTRNCSMDPAVVRKNMALAFGETMAFMQSNGVCPAGPAISVYYTYSETELEFRAGFIVTEEDMEKADGTVKADKTPATKVLTYTHVGPYSKLRDTYSEMMTYLEESEHHISAPTWEIYVNDPDSTSEDELRTDIYIAIT